MLVLILDRTAAIERIVALATEPRVPEQFMLFAPSGVRGVPDVWRLAPASATAVEMRDREPVLAGGYHAGPLW